MKNNGFQQFQQQVQRQQQIRQRQMGGYYAQQLKQQQGQQQPFQRPPLGGNYVPQIKRPQQFNFKPPLIDPKLVSPLYARQRQLAPKPVTPTKKPGLLTRIVDWLLD